MGHLFPVQALIPIKTPGITGR
ncbi:hypothetical protein D039_0756A, partial [Vibrio parahaemolyticus EKP-028]